MRCEFRETHTILGLETLQSDVDSTLRSWNLRRYGPQLEVMVVRKKINEHRSAWYKINEKIGFSVINSHFYEEFGRELSATVFRLDCESAVVRSIKEVYGPSAKIRLCCVHIARNWRKKFIEAVGKPEFESDIFQGVWAILRGSFFCHSRRWELLLIFSKLRFYQMF